MSIVPRRKPTTSPRLIPKPATTRPPNPAPSPPPTKAASPTPKAAPPPPSPPPPSPPPVTYEQVLADAYQFWALVNAPGRLWVITPGGLADLEEITRLVFERIRNLGGAR